MLLEAGAAVDARDSVRSSSQSLLLLHCISSVPPQHQPTNQHSLFLRPLMLSLSCGRLSPEVWRDAAAVGGGCHLLRHGGASARGRSGPRRGATAGGRPPAFPPGACCCATPSYSAEQYVWFKSLMRRGGAYVLL